jgi:hypothetical protein
LSDFSLSNPILPSGICAATNKNWLSVDIKRGKIFEICVTLFWAGVAFWLLSGK